MKRLYLLPTQHCNINCPHCNIAKYTDEVYDEDELLDVVNSFDGHIILFGGECTLYEDRFKKMLDTGKINGISTNLIDISGERTKLLANRHIATSWDKSRFTSKQYISWMCNMSKLSGYGTTITILITLTEDLIEEDPSKLINRIKIWNSIEGVKSIKLSQLVDSTKDQSFYDRVDEWLCEFHKLFINENFRVINEISDHINRWYFDCRETYTVFPDGRLVNKCPHDDYPVICEKCDGCKYSHVCCQCRLQKNCTFPKKLYDLIMEGK